MGDVADFSGYATKANLKCSDGRTILPDAFKGQDKMTVPLVWHHMRNEPDNVLGHAILENRPDGVYCYGYFNETPKAVTSKTLVKHGDISSLSIYANQLVEKSKQVMHGIIREVSLVVAGANPGARIDNIAIQHGDGPFADIETLEDEAYIFSGTPLEHGIGEDDDEEDGDDVEHASSNMTVQDVVDGMSEEQKNVLYYLVGQAIKGPSAQHADEDEAPENLPAIVEHMSKEQQDVLGYLVSQALEHAEDSAPDDDEDEGDEEEQDAVDHAATNTNQEGSIVTRNAFEHNDATGGTIGGTTTLQHGAGIPAEDMKKIVKHAERYGSLKAAMEEYAETNSFEHGIQDIDILFPDAKNVGTTPDWVARRMEWVDAVLSGTRHTPFARIKSTSANLTLTEARAKGYVKGNLKEEEFFRVSKRTTDPQTIYKKQQLDRDDIIDITDFNVVVWLKGEMRLMLDEEIARAILIGDGRSSGDNDKIKEDKIRPIAKDDDFYVAKFYVNLGDANSTTEEVVDAITLNRRYYRGSGSPDLFIGEGLLSQFLLIKDTTGRRIYNSPQDLATAMRVRNIVTCELMDDPASKVAAIIVNLSDYNVGTNQGGEVSLFDDFDIDYNQYKYLIETRMSGALVKPRSALVVYKTAGSDTLVNPVAPTWNGTNHTVTVATTTGITYKNKLTNATLTTGSPVTLSSGEELQVIAVPNSGYYLTSNQGDEYRFTYTDGQADVSY